jgi:hypothetical protein
MERVKALRKMAAEELEAAAVELEAAAAVELEAAAAVELEVSNMGAATSLDGVAVEVLL